MTPGSSSHHPSAPRYETPHSNRQGTPSASPVGASQFRNPNSRRTTLPSAPTGPVSTNNDGPRRASGKPSSASTSPAAGKSKRVRTGCLTCRERHLKCDEGVPECNNCRKSNRECRRGIRLNFIDIQVKDPPYLSPSAEWSVQILDESRSIASEYKGGLGRYASAIPSPPPADSDVPGGRRVERPGFSEPAEYRFPENGHHGDGPATRDPYHPHDVGQPPPPHEQPNYHAGPETHVCLGRTPPTARPAQMSQPSRAAHVRDSSTYSTLHAPDTANEHGPHVSHVPHMRDRGVLFTPSRLTPQPTEPPSYSSRPVTHTIQSQPLSTPTGLMTPSSENTSCERDYLSTEEEIRFLQVFIDDVSTWMDAMGKVRHFANIVPYLALRLPMLLNALLACGARQLTLIGQHDGERADYYYHLATTQLSRIQQERGSDLSDCALTAVVLDAYHIMEDNLTQRMGHIASTRARIRDCGWDASSTGLGAACFWVNIGMDVLSCLAFGWPIAWDPDQWGMDQEFMTAGSVSRSGSRSIAGSEDLWLSPIHADPQSEHHQSATHDNPDHNDEEVWLRRIFHIMAKVVNFRVHTPQFQEPSPHEEQVRLQNRLSEWRRLQNMCNAWNLNCPRSMRPFGYSSGPSPRSLFPNVWLIKPSSKLARLFYHTAMCLLAQTNPLDPRDSRENRASQLHHAHHVCGIVAHATAVSTTNTKATLRINGNGVHRPDHVRDSRPAPRSVSNNNKSDRAVISVAVRTLAAVSDALVDRAEQDEVLDVLDRITGETGWRLGRVMEEIKGGWGRVD
ncbi:uncharacterized protein C8A04DRAFT_9602 [Dichotomopilus funicola]|uniref:Zn(2)-C6 fungal-type domain-containing protein n=1 Tax=Dichotomopilus funicola TaxID=1934379 RepID=A0AAN6V819_9PEZI|nr:hypothetical protein C8A04DRAFT_9602 [Dichotomopilus funicola]